MKITIEYLAGFFDGEGCVYMKKYKTQKDVLIIKITQKDKDILLNIKDQYGGWLESDGNIIHHCWKWVLTGKKAAKLCHSLLPSLIVKKEKVTYFLKFAGY